jgi:NTP pyrophosphatase (non-canonical NTP hydrolase)
MDETLNTMLKNLASMMRANSERWFPGIHREDAQLPLIAFYSMGLTGEAGEAQDAIKKFYRDGGVKHLEQARTELSDVFTYLLLLADELNIDLMVEYEKKVVLNEQRFYEQRFS